MENNINALSNSKPIYKYSTVFSHSRIEIEYIIKD